MKKLLILAGLALGMASLSAPASARNYDCSKAGNANKSACRAPKPMTVASHKVTEVKTTKVTRASARNYDCSKAGNKKKAVCRTSSADAAPVTAPVIAKTTKVTTQTYDCTKFYNKMRAACRVQGTSTTTAKAPAAVPTPVNRPTIARSTGTTVSRSVTADSTGATAQCKDGSFSHAQHRSGACSRHGGVAKWF